MVRKQYLLVYDCCSEWNLRQWLARLFTAPRAATDRISSLSSYWSASRNSLTVGLPDMNPNRTLPPTPHL